MRPRLWIICFVSCWFSSLAAIISFFEEFWPDEAFTQSKSAADLLVVIWPRKMLGRTNFKFVKLLKDKNVDLERTRDLVVSSCRGCANYDALRDLWKITEDDVPAIMLFPGQQEFGDTGRFKLPLVGVDDPLDSLKTFLSKHDSGQLVPWVPSEPAPKEEDQGPVREVVGSTYRTEVMDADVNIILLLYSSWCGWSKKVQPIFKQLAARVGKNSLIKFAQLNSHNNDIPPPYNINTRLGVPRFLLLKRGQKGTPEEFSEKGNMEYEHLLSWLREKVEGLAAMLDEPRQAVEEDESGFGDLDGSKDL